MPRGVGVGGVWESPLIVVLICSGQEGGERHYWTEDRTKTGWGQIGGVICPRCGATAKGIMFGEGDEESFKAYMANLRQTPILYVAMNIE